MNIRTKTTIIFGALITLCLVIILPLGFTLSSASPKKHKWVNGWHAASQRPLNKGLSHKGFRNQTIRMVIYPHINGNKIRLTVSNTFGTEPVTFSQVSVARSSKGANILPGSSHNVTFNGKRQMTLMKGKTIASDPIPISVESHAPLTVSLYVKHSGPVTWHRFSMQDTYISLGNHTSDLIGTPFNKKINAWVWLNSLDVYTGSSVKGTIAVVGDSIANGSHSSMNSNHRWPDLLAKRLNGNSPMHWSIVNSGIPSNRLLSETIGTGERLSKRLDRDAFDLTDIKAIILHEGINDLRRYPNTHAEDIISEMKTIIARTHQHGLKIYVATLAPYKGSRLYTERGEKTREAINHWIRTSNELDGVIDFDKTLRDPIDPKRMRSDYHSGDHIHPNDKGYQAMADSIDLSLFDSMNMKKERQSKYYILQHFSKLFYYSL